MGRQRHRGAEKFFVETMGIDRFMHMENLAAKDTEGTYLGKPGNWVCHLYLAYAGDTQIELIQPVSGESMYQESLDRHGDAVQHVAYFLEDSAYAAAAAHMESSGYPEIQSFRLPIARVGYFDTRPAVGVVTSKKKSSLQMPAASTSIRTPTRQVALRSSRSLGT